MISAIRDAMAKRTAILIRCSTKEAALIRGHAATERRTMSAYILLKLSIALRVEESLFKHLKNQPMPLPNELWMSSLPGRRTALLLRCTPEESNQIHKAARRREMSMSNFVMYALRRAWAAAETIQHAQPTRKL